MAKKIIIFSGPSGSGKTTIAKKMLEEFPVLSFSISATTRRPRLNEKDGQDYYFLKLSDFKNSLAKDEFIEYQQVYENIYYGTLKSEINRIWSADKIPLLDIDVFGAINIKKIYGEKALAIFIHPGGIETLRERLLNRKSESPEKMKERVKKAEREIAQAPHFDITVKNDKDLETTIIDVTTILKKFMNP
jgi:guanylate kinase